MYNSMSIKLWFWFVKIYILNGPVNKKELDVQGCEYQLSKLKMPVICHEIIIHIYALYLCTVSALNT